MCRVTRLLVRLQGGGVCMCPVCVHMCVCSYVCVFVCVCVFMCSPCTCECVYLYCVLCVCVILCALRYKHLLAGVCKSLMCYVCVGMCA